MQSTGRSPVFLYQFDMPRFSFIIPVCMLVGPLSGPNATASFPSILIRPTQTHSLHFGPLATASFSFRSRGGFLILTAGILFSPTAVTATITSFATPNTTPLAFRLSLPPALL